MPSRRDVESLRDANAAVRTLAVAEFRALWATIEQSWSSERIRDYLSEYVPLIVAKYGEVAAGIAADMYDAMRAGVNVAGVYAAVLADPPAVEQVRTSVRANVTSLFQQDRDFNAVLALIAADTVDRLALGRGKETIGLNTELDPAGPRWALVPFGKTCDWCLKIASWGAVRWSRVEAKAGLHGNCNCTPTVVWPDDDYPAGYDPRAISQRLQATSA